MFRTPTMDVPLPLLYPDVRISFTNGGIIQHDSVIQGVNPLVRLYGRNI